MRLLFSRLENLGRNKVPDSRGQGSPRPAGKGMRPGWGGRGAPSALEGACLWGPLPPPGPAATFPGDPPSLLGFSKGITRRLLSAGPRGSSGRLALSETGRWDFPLLLPGRSHTPSASRDAAAPALPGPGRPPRLVQRRLGRSSVSGKGGIGASGGRPCWGSPRPRQRPPGTGLPGLAGFAFLERSAPPPPQQSLADCSPGGEREGEAAAEALRHVGGCLRGRARPASPPDRLSWSVRGPLLPHGRGWLSDSASGELDRREGAHGRGDWELRSPVSGGPAPSEHLKAPAGPALPLTGMRWAPFGAPGTSGQTPGSAV